MDLPYAVQQLDHEIAFSEARLAEKKDAREKLASALSPDQLAPITEAREKIRAKLKLSDPAPAATEKPPKK